MSIAKKLKEMEELNKVQAEQIEGMEASMVEKDGVIEASKVEADTKMAELTEKVEALEKAEAEQKEAIAKVEAEKVEASEQLKKAEAELSLPAYKDAKAEGEKDVADSTVAEDELDEKAEAEKVIKAFEAMGDKQQAWLVEDDNHAKLQEAANTVNG